MSENRKKGMRSMSKLFMHGTSLEEIEQWSYIKIREYT